MKANLSVENVTVAFGGLKALNNVSIAFPGGQITGLIGPNGSGKSTMINTISGQLTPSAGSVRLGAQEINGLRSDQIAVMGLARTYQIPRVPPQLTVQEVISVPFSYVRRKSHLAPGIGDERSIAEFCGLSPVVMRRCGDLSITDLRRLEIARALACGPDVLLLDEVMAGLSHEDAHAVIEIVRRIHAAGVTVVIVEHVMSIIANLCDRVVVLNQGELLADGKPKDVLSAPSVREAYLGKGFKL
ncbi:ABC transporter ATP-binding protein [Paralcaligenes ureilyticus]|uniref:Branched-chain amino acid transport system ATP-binding protein n=1 Tax=Paralcaligenes ureilyticus TaxID=627131 RepID=A0A4R3LW80_9BURK|nr:ABC transporter ATP-binding protein [Paralcaligenes ureilyticus]TCT04824.1 branched-chain amino acid transport system ATP-binding protein [Paralcaligenes ureilyticus]